MDEVIPEKETADQWNKNIWESMSELNLCMQQNIQGTEKQFLLKETSF